MNKYEIINETNEEIKELEEINNVVEFALKYQKINNAIFNIIIVDENTIHELNKEYSIYVYQYVREDEITFLK